MLARLIASVLRITTISQWVILSGAKPIGFAESKDLPQNNKEILRRHKTSGFACSE
ncbi:MAG: hypothetical protein LW855_01870 [Alphaproteobacteria bacterium]|nr:hypothetical protein [Alphaproteobacteria bacterium]